MGVPGFEPGLFSLELIILAGLYYTPRKTYNTTNEHRTSANIQITGL